MGKRNLCLYVDDELINLASSRNINLSKLFNDLISIEMEFRELSDTTSKEELISKLKTRVALLTDELRLINEKFELCNKESQDLKKTIEEMKKTQKAKKPEERVIEWHPKHHERN